MYTLKMVLRNTRITLSVIAAVAALTFFLSVYTNSIQTSQEQLDQVYAVTNVTARISGFGGGATARLEADKYDRILSSGFVKSSHALIQQTVRGKDILRALDYMDLDPDLSGWAPYITWLDGYDAVALTGEEAVCLVPKALEIGLGETISLPLGSGGDKLTMELTVIGLYGKEYRSVNDKTVYYCPLKTLENFLHNHSERIIYNFMEMELQNLKKLGDFKAEMKALGMGEGGVRLTINDSLLQHVTSKLRQHIRLLGMLLPVLLAVVSGIGFGLSFLLLRGRKREVAVLRSLGAERGRVFKMLLSENAIQVLLGTLLGGCLAFAVMGNTAFQLRYLLLITFSFLIGGAVAMWQLVNTNVFTVMAGE